MANKKLTDVKLDTEINEETDSVITDSNGSVMKITFAVIKVWITGVINKILETYTTKTYVDDEINQLSEEKADKEHTHTDYALKTDVPSDEHINSLIDLKLGVIENGSY